MQFFPSVCEAGIGTLRQTDAGVVAANEYLSLQTLVTAFCRYIGPLTRTAPTRRVVDELFSYGLPVLFKQFRQVAS